MKEFNYVPPVRVLTKGEGATFGKLVHRLFEKVDWSQPVLIEKMAEIEGKNIGATGPMIKRVGEMVREAINSPLLQRIGQLPEGSPLHL